MREGKLMVETLEFLTNFLTSCFPVLSQPANTPALVPSAPVPQERDASSSHSRAPIPPRKESASESEGEGPKLSTPPSVCPPFSLRPLPPSSFLTWDMGKPVAHAPDPAHLGCLVRRDDVLVHQTTTLISRPHSPSREAVGVLVNYPVVNSAHS